MEIYIIRAKNPLDMEGYADVVAVFLDKERANDARELLQGAEEVKTKALSGERWFKFAIDYTVEEWNPDDDPQVVLAQLYS